MAKFVRTNFKVPLWQLKANAPGIANKFSAKNIPKHVASPTEKCQHCSNSASLSCLECSIWICSVHVKACSNCHQLSCASCHNVCEVKQWYDAWSIDKKFPLVQCASDFYLLERIAAELDFDALTGAVKQEAEKAMAELYEPLIVQMETQIANYLEMVVGGELRHWNGAGTAASTGQMTLPLDADQKKAVSQLYQGALSTSGGKVGRPVAWARWRKFCDEKGLLAPELAVVIFNHGGWGGAMGGKKWGKIAETLVRYRKGLLTPKAFVDTSLGLQHNCNNVFDKVWASQIPQLKVVLDANLKNQLSTLQGFASPKVREIYTRVFADEKIVMGVSGKIMPEFTVDKAVNWSAYEQAPEEKKQNYILSVGHNCVACSPKSKKPCSKVHATYKPITQTWHCYKCQQAIPMKVLKLADDGFNKKFALCSHCIKTVVSGNVKVVGSILPA